MKDKKLSIRISGEDLQTLHHKADKANLSITDYVTKCSLGKQIFVVDGLEEVIRQQKAIGRNLNQLTTLCNMRKVDCVNLQSLTDEYANSEYGRKSPSELKAQAKMNLAQAAQTETYVSITEKNWRALIQPQQTQIDMLSTMMNTIETLATWSEINELLKQQIEELKSHSEQTQQTLTEFQDTLQKQAEQIQSQTLTSMESLQLQAGKTSEEFSKKLYSAEEQTKNSLKKIIAASLIPTILLIIWELIRHIWLRTR